MGDGTRRTTPADRVAGTKVHLLELAAQRLAEESWDFRCECGDPECAEYVALTLPEYEALGDRGGAILAPGHQLFPPRSTRERSVELRDEAHALQGQARHQVGRARRNLELATERTARPRPPAPPGSESAK